MADRGELKDTFAHIEADASEMDQFRSNLSLRLPQKSASPWWRQPMLIPALLVATSFIVYFTKPAEHLQVPGDSPEDWVTFAAGVTDPQALIAHARKLVRSDKTIEVHQGQVLLCTLLGKDDALPLVIDALKAETAPNLRVFYLEWILENADEYQYNIGAIEALMETEDDPLCFKLYRQWLKVALIG